jgi:lipoate-protein ligase B
MPEPRALAVGTPGLVDYGTALGWQEVLVARRLAGGEDALLLLEHPAVYTLGRGGDARHLRAAAGGAVPIWRVGRGGQVTYHGPGQLIGYPVLDLADLRPDLHWYLHGLEEVLIRTLADVGIAAGRVSGRTGVWIDGRRKIASIGVGLRRWVTRHGFALNVGPDLSGFAAITPCGLEGVEMTSVAREGGSTEVTALLPVVLERFLGVFGYAVWRRLQVSTLVPVEGHA